MWGTRTGEPSRQTRASLGRVYNNNTARLRDAQAQLAQCVVPRPALGGRLVFFGGVGLTGGECIYVLGPSIVSLNTKKSSSSISMHHIPVDFEG